jgi:hypothetical protein
VRHFVPPGESAKLWQQRFYITFSKHDPAQPKQSLRTRAEAVCQRNSREKSAQLKKMGKPDCTVTCNFISENETSLVFEIPQACGSADSSYQLVRWMADSEGMYYFSYLQNRRSPPTPGANGWRS